MKLVRFGQRGQEKPGIVDAAGRVRDVSSVVAGWSPETIGPANLAELRKLDLSKFPEAKIFPFASFPRVGIL